MVDSLLETITTGTVPRPRKCLLYGVHGIGKSTWAAGADHPVFIDLEDGLAEIDCKKFPVAQSTADVLAQLTSLRSGDHEFQTVIIDSVDWLERIIWGEVCRNAGKESIESISFGKGYGEATAVMARILAALTSLRNNTEMNVVLLAHSQIEKFESPGLDTYDRYSPKLHKKASALVQEWADETLFANYRVMVQQKDEGFKTRTKAVGSGERIIYTCERPSHLAKSRLKLPVEIEMTWSAYSEHFNAKDRTNG